MKVTIKSKPTQIRFSKHHKWNKAVSEAEALVGFPTSVDALQMIAANNGSSSMTAYIKKLMASDHPGWIKKKLQLEKLRKTSFVGVNGAGIKPNPAKKMDKLNLNLLKIG